MVISFTFLNNTWWKCSSQEPFRSYSRSLDDISHCSPSEYTEWDFDWNLIELLCDNKRKHSLGWVTSLSGWKKNPCFRRLSSVTVSSILQSVGLRGSAAILSKSCSVVYTYDTIYSTVLLHHCSPCLQPANWGRGLRIFFYYPWSK